MKDYRVVRLPTPRSRLDHPSVRFLARKLRFKVRHPSFVPSPAVIQALIELRNALNDVIEKAECT